MFYQNITHDDMLNGDGLRTVLWVSGCSHHCPGCQNPCTWNPNDGIPFGESEIIEIMESLNKDYISGITLSGGDPLYVSNRDTILNLVKVIREKYPNKTIWLYTGYTWEQIEKNKKMFAIASFCDVLIDGRYEESKRDISLPWRGSSNQRVIDIKQTIISKEVIHYVI